MRGVGARGVVLVRLFSGTAVGGGSGLSCLSDDAASGGCQPVGVRCAWMLAAVLSCVPAGCRHDSADGPSHVTGDGRTAAVGPADVPRFTADQLSSSLGNYLPPLDGGRVELAPPAGWHVVSRDRRYVARFVLDRRHRALLPRITITAEDSPFDELVDLDASTVEIFRDRVSERFDETTHRALLEPARSMILGDVPCVRYVVGKRFSRDGREIPAECQVIVTLHQSRLYTISLDVYAGKLLDHHNDAYAVVAGLVFHKIDVESKPAPAADQPPWDEPEEMVPDEDEEIDPFG
jgi:hypothetical protein